MKQLTHLIIYILFIVNLLGCTAAVNHSTQEQSTDTPTASIAVAEQEKILQNIKNAVKSGKSEINIFLDETPDVIQEGDLVTINITATTEEGELINTTLVELANRADQRWVRGQGKPKTYHPVEVIAGAGGEFPGVTQTVVGMMKGERRVARIQPEEAFGNTDHQKVKQYPSVRQVPRIAHVAPADFVNQYRIFPVTGDVFDFNPYLKARVLEVKNDGALLEISKKPDEEMEKVSYGTTDVSLQDDVFTIRLKPEKGALFEMGKTTGQITDVQEDSFTVDFNHPMAGRPMILDIEIIDFIKASIAHNFEISWLEEYEAGIQAAREQNKPMVLLLYANWCQWSQGMINNVLKDPRVAVLHDQFIWVKIDSDMHLEYKEAFEQKSFPKLLILNPQEEILQSLDGYQNVHIVSELLHEIQPLTAAG